MQIKLANNIKYLRKQAKMTQEQLAEALGVTTGAVYKWERGISTPDISLIMEMAELFSTSTDVLLGYEWRSCNAGAAYDRLVALAAERRLEEAAAEAEMAIKKYPNSFNIVYQAALVYLTLGEDPAHRQVYARAIELLGHACELLDQNQDSAISEVSLQAQLARAQLLSGNTEAALHTLKKYNACGINNAMIGMVFGDYLHNADEAEKYLGRAFRAYIDDINFIMVGYANVFFLRHDYDTAIDCFRWLRTVLRGIQPCDELTWFDKYDCVLLETIAECYCFKGELSRARDHLRDAVKKAQRYDLAAPRELGDMKFLSALHLESQPTYDLYGKTAMDCLQRRIEPEDDSVPHMRELWAEVTEEVLHGGAV